MYSFARYRAHNALVGGFIQEFPQRLSLGKETEVKIKVFEIPVNEEQYDNVREFIYQVRDDAEQCIYNSLAIFGRPFGLGYNTYKAYVCTDFVVKALVHGEINLTASILYPMTPVEIEKLLDPFLIYKGSLEEYKPAPAYDESMIQDFFAKDSFFRELYSTALHFYRLFSRAGKGKKITV